jgi:tetratricopeptide (TPR) repeat protein
MTIRTILMLWLAWQTMSPEAAQHWEAGRRAESEKHFDIAAGEYRKVTQLEPNFAAGFVSLGQTLMEQRDYAAAVAPLKHALELDSTLAPAHQLLGYALLAQGYAAEAIPHLERVHEQGALGIAQLETGQLAESIMNLQAALKKRPNDPDLLYYQGRAGGLLSKQSIDTLLAAYPRSARACQALAENYFVLRQMPDAEKQYQQALQLRPDMPNLPSSSFAPRSSCNLETRKRSTAWERLFFSKASHVSRGQNWNVPTDCSPRCQKRSTLSERPPRSTAMLLPQRKPGSAC